MKPQALEVTVSPGVTVSALLLKPRKAFTCFVFAHGAGAGMDHAFMHAMADSLAALNVATLRYQFPFIEEHLRRPDRPATCHASVRSAVALAKKLVPDLPLIAGGKSFGGRMTSQAQALEPLSAVIGLALFAFPWHPPKQPALERSEHFASIHIPALFMQGERDAMGNSEFVTTQVRRLGKATLLLIPWADHGFHVPAKSGRTDAEVQEALAHAFANWAASII